MKYTNEIIRTQIKDIGIMLETGEIQEAISMVKFLYKELGPEEEEKIKLTKKEFKERVLSQKYVGLHTTVNVLFYDWKQGFGYKYMIYANNKDVNKKELHDLLWLWVTKNLQAPPQFDNKMIRHHVLYKMAETDETRFKVPLSIKS